MRPSEDQIKLIISIIQAGTPEPCAIYLFGSRTDDSLKGGDIDLLAVSSDKGCLDLRREKYKILVALKKSPLVGERKIDFLISTENQLSQDPFLKSISTEKLRLN